MADRPIIFSAPMVRALLEGRKTQTRRFINPQPPAHITGAGTYSTSREGPTNRWSWLSGDMTDADSWEFEGDFKAPAAIGDRMYVREAHAIVGTVDPGWVLYRASGYEAECARYGFDEHSIPPENEVKWRPSIHMPRWASRITLTVTDVRVQRLQEIGEEDAVAEGVRKLRAEFGYSTARQRFHELWSSLHADEGKRWEDNPWIVAISFDVEQRNIDR